MCACPIVVFHVRQQHVTKMSLVGYHDLIDALPAERQISIFVLQGARHVGQSRERPLIEVFGPAA
jgi:hypothetical protein